MAFENTSNVTLSPTSQAKLQRQRERFEENRKRMLSENRTELSRPDMVPFPTNPVSRTIDYADVMYDDAVSERRRVDPPEVLTDRFAMPPTPYGFLQTHVLENDSKSKTTSNKQKTNNGKKPRSNVFVEESENNEVFTIGVDDEDDHMDSSGRRDQLPNIEQVKARSRFGPNRSPRKVSKDGDDGFTRTMRILMGAGILVILATVSLTVGLILNKDSNSSNNSDDSDSLVTNNAGVDLNSTLAPTVIPDDSMQDESTQSPLPSDPEGRLQWIKEAVVALNWTSEEDISFPSSPQSVACEWIAQEDKVLQLSNGILSTESGHRQLFAERYALAVLFNSLNGNNWTYNPFFMEGSRSVCDWSMKHSSSSKKSASGRYDPSDVTVGVICMAGTFVQDLYLPSNNMTGTIPSEIRLLSYLKNINLYNNQISGSIPSEIGENTKLVALQLHKNQFDAMPLPSFLGSLPNIRVINLSYNRFVATIPFEYGMLSKLETIDLSYNQLTGAGVGLRSLQGLSNLVSIQMSNNNISSPLEDDQLQSWTSLRILDVSDNDMVGSLPLSLFETSNLVVADLHGNKFTGSLPNQLKVGGGSLKFLAVNDNQLSGPIDERITLLDKLEHLDLSKNLFTGTISSEIGSLTNLEYLFLANNQELALQTIPTELGKLTALRDLSLQDSNRFGLIPTELQHCKNLTLLDLNNNDLSGELPRELAAARSLQFLLLKDNFKLGGTIPEDYILLEELDTFVLYGTGVTSGAAQLCDDVSGIASLTEFVADCNVLSDCAGSSGDICCTDCCDSNDVNNSCKDRIWYSDVNPTQLSGYTRQNYFFRPEDTVDPKAIAAEQKAIREEQQMNSAMFEDLGTMPYGTILNP